MPKVKTYAYVRKVTSTSRGKANCTVSGCDVSMRIQIMLEIIKLEGMQFLVLKLKTFSQQQSDNN